jgi:hypothetical protein
MPVVLVSALPLEHLFQSRMKTLTGDVVVGRVLILVLLELEKSQKKKLPDNLVLI